ncbi:MAG: ABC transporter permease [Cyanobacteriota bacterium]
MSIPIFIIKRLIHAIPILILVSMLGFAIMRLSPVDPLGELRITPGIAEETIKAEEKRLGLDKPLVVQYFIWASGFLKGDLGISKTNQPVASRIMERVPNTLVLVITSILVSWCIAIPLGVFAALRWRSKTDRILTILASIGMAIPSFFFALLLLIFAVRTGWFPVGGLTSVGFEKMNLFQQFLDLAHHLILPVTVIATISVAGIQRQMRANLLDVLEADYVKMARAKGLPENKVINKHALRNAINPLVTLLGFEFAGLLSGSALVEMVLQYPGLGRLILQAVLELDLNLVMASLMIGTIMLIIGNLIADILLKFVDPRITLG